MLFIALVSGCEREKVLSIEKQPGDNLLVKIPVNIYKKGDNIISKSIFADDISIRDINLLVYNALDNLISTEYYSFSTGISLTTSTGYKTIVAIANAGQKDFSDYNTLESIRTAVASQLVNENNCMLMTGEASGYLAKGKPVSIVLSRLISKVSVVFYKSGLDGNTSINISKIELKNVANQCKYLSNNTTYSSTQIDSNGDYLTSNLEPSSHSNASPLYLFENMQGNIGNSTSEGQKNPGTVQPFCSYLEVTANYSSRFKTGTIKYRFYLGNDVYNNFDVCRNTWYQIDVSFSGTGINEVSWRIDTSELMDTDPTIHVTGISLNRSSAELNVGENVSLTATVFPSDATDKSVTWSSSDPDIANVDGNGLVTALSNGTTTITATSADGGYVSNCNIIVYKVVDLYFYFYRTAKLRYKNENGGYWYLSEPMYDEIYLRASGGDNISGTISYTIEWAYSPSSGFSMPAPSSGTKSITISSAMDVLLEFGEAWGNETDLEIDYPIITVNSYSPIETSSYIKIRVNRSLDTYYTYETGR